MTHILSGQLSGRSRYPPSMTNFSTCSLDKPWYGCSASVLISHSTTPNDLQTKQTREQMHQWCHHDCTDCATASEVWRTSSQSWQWRLHPSETLEPSTWQEAGPSHLYGSSQSRRCLGSCQSLRGTSANTVSQPRQTEMDVNCYMNNKENKTSFSYLRSWRCSPRPPCSSWLPDLCGQTSWRWGRPCRLQFLLPSGSSLSV